MLVDNEVQIPTGLPTLPRMGVLLSTPAGFETLDWLGRGPHESYWDRQAGAPVGRYQGTVSGQFVPYILPQEHGNLTDVRWLSVAQHGGPRLLVVARGLLEAGASHYTPADLYAAKHTHELRPRAETILTVDWHQRGLGTASCGPDTLPGYTLGAGGYRFAFWLRPCAAADDPGTLARQLPLG